MKRAVRDDTKIFDLWLALWGWNFLDWSRFGRDMSGGQGKGLAWSHPDGGEITKGVNIAGEGHQRLTWGSGLTGTGLGCFFWPLLASVRPGGSTEGRPGAFPPLHLLLPILGIELKGKS